MKKRYEDTDLYTMEHPDLRHHARMPISERAAQFLPFSALSGYEESLAEEERQTEKRKILVPEEKEKIRIRLTRISCGEKKDVEILYFEEDERKKGGCYLTHSGKVRQVDDVDLVVVFEDGTRIPFSAIDGIRIL